MTEGLQDIPTSHYMVGLRIYSKIWRSSVDIMAWSGDHARTWDGNRAATSGYQSAGGPDSYPGAEHKMPGGGAGIERN